MRIEGIANQSQGQNQTRMADTTVQERVIREDLKEQSTNNGQLGRESKENILNEDELIHIIEEANKDFLFYDRKFEFSIHEETKAIMVKVINAGTEEIIREIPSEKILDMVAKMWEMAGIFVDEKV
ncbi:flagellar protein FlaG [Natronospora cellulosivora (SeqCode)]